MAVYTKLTKQEIENHLENYDLGKLIDFSEIIAGIDNSNFIINIDGVKYILTIFEKRIKEQDLPFFVELKRCLANSGICCPKPILSKNGDLFVDVKGKKSAIVSFLSGKTLQPRNDGYYDNITQNHCFEVGKVVAKMHLAALDFKMRRENDLGVFSFENYIKKFEGEIDKYGSGLKSEILNVIADLKSNWSEDLESGAVHLDLFPDNVFFDEDEKLSGVIDFYFAANDLLIYDFAIVVNAWCFDENNVFDEGKFLSLKKGYEEFRKISAKEDEFLKFALVTASLRFLLTRIHDKAFTEEGSVVNVKDPQEYLQKFRYFLSEL